MSPGHVWLTQMSGMCASWPIIQGYKGWHGQGHVGEVLDRPNILVSLVPEYLVVIIPKVRGLIYQRVP